MPQSFGNIRDFDLIVLGEVLAEFTCENDITNSSTFRRDIGGSDLYVAAAAARLGSGVRFVSAIGRDPFESFIRDRLISQGINVDYITTCEGSNGIYFLADSRTEERDYLYNRPGSAATHIGPASIFDTLVESAKILYASSELQSSSKSARQAVFKAFNMAHTAGVMVAYDPNLRLQRWTLDDAKEVMWSVLPLIDVIFPSAPHESKALFGYERPLDVIGFMWDHDIETVVVKNGANGCLVGYDKHIEEFAVPELAKPFIYPSLAGSAFNGGFLHSIARGNDPFTAAQTAIRVASYKGMNGNGIVSLPQKES